jgi:hypothetical protein
MAKGLTTNRVLLIVLALLGGGAALKAFVFKRTGETGESAQASAALFASLNKDDVSALLIEAPENKKYELAKDGDHWNVVSEGNARADQADVNKALDAVAKLKKGRVQSTNLDKLATYGLDDAHATRIKVFGKEGRSGAPVAAFALGKIEGDWRNSFLKLPDEQAIRKVEGAASDFEPGTDNTWRDKTMFDLGPADKISQFEIAGPKGTVVAVREKVMGPKEKKADGAAEPTPPADGTTPEKPADGEQEVKEVVWSLLEPQKARAKKWLCDSIAGYVAKLECDSFGAESDKAAEIGLDPPQYVIKVRREARPSRRPCCSSATRARTASTR